MNMYEAPTPFHSSLTAVRKQQVPHMHDTVIQEINAVFY